MRTTIIIRDDLFRQAKSQAAATGRTLTQWMEDALREKLFRRARARPSPSLALPTYRGKGVRPGVNLDSHADLLDMMERP